MDRPEIVLVVAVADNGALVLNALDARAGGGELTLDGYFVRTDRVQDEDSLEYRSGLRNDAQLIGFHGDAAAPTAILLKNNGLRFVLNL